MFCCLYEVDFALPQIIAYFHKVFPFEFKQRREKQVNYCRDDLPVEGHDLYYKPLRQVWQLRFTFFSLAEKLGLDPEHCTMV